MKVFITGITGLLGRHVAELCVREGHEVFALIRNKNLNNSNYPFPLTICYGDITHLDSISEYFKDIDIVIHCAADTNMISRKNQQQIETNVDGTKNLILASKKGKIKKFIHISTANTIIPGNAMKPNDESQRLIASKKILPYIKTKIIGEEILLQEHKLNNFPVIILNPTFILGPKDFNRSSGKLILQVINKKIPFYPCGGKNIVDVRDIATVVINAFNDGRIGSNYILSNENLTYKELFSKSCSYAKVKAPKYQMPNFFIKLIGALGTCYECLTKKTISINHLTAKISLENHYYTSDKAKTELGFKPRSIEETIKDTVNWFQYEYTQR